ncbi:hypothetical protein NMY22_g13123 [Coprinellus aureogranulatus]|nr:hypothetical protein NMY22_g13123 [Coprinellus aureogranulatus]
MPDSTSAEGDASASQSESGNQCSPSLHAFAGSQGVSIGSFSATTAGRDINIHYNFGNANSPGVEPPATAAGPRTIEAQRRVILESLKAPSFQAVYQQGLSQRMDNTGLWFLEMYEFKRFVEGKGVILWCTGMPGAGKTILASASIERVEQCTQRNPKATMAFVFIRYSERYTLRDVLAALLSQLIEANDTACAAICPIYTRSSTAKNGKEVMESDMIKGLRDIARSLDKVHIFVDGLDEASDEVKDGLLAALVSSGVNLLIFSRPLPLFTRHALGALFVSIQARTEDIDTYVRAEVSGSSRLQSIIGNQPEKLSELSDKINKSSEGMFLVAKLQMEVIKRTARSASSLSRKLKELPAGVNAMYALTLERIKESNDVDIAFRVFAWIITGERYLTITCLQQALSFNPESLDFDTEDLIPEPLILNSCHGLVEVDPYSHVRFIHYTTYEYMKAMEIVGISNPAFLRAITCLACMDKHRETVLKIVADGTEHSQSIYPLLKIRELGNPESIPHSGNLLHYAHARWDQHVEQALEDCSTHPAIHSLLFKHDAQPFYLRIQDSYDSPFRMEIGTGMHLAAICGLTIPRCQVQYSNFLSKPRGYTPFHLLAMDGRFHDFQTLLTSCSGVNLRSADGSTILHIAVNYDQVMFITQLHRLVRSQAEDPHHELPKFNVNAQDAEGRTPLMIACDLAQEETVRLFVSCSDINVDLLDSAGKCALIYAVQERTVTNCVHRQDAAAFSLCSLPGHDMNIYDSSGNTPFMMACVSGLERTVRHMLASSKGNPMLVLQRNYAGQTALMLLSTYERGLRHDPDRVSARLVIFRLLLAHGSDAYARDRNGMQPFLLAVDPEGGEGRPIFVLSPEHLRTGYRECVLEELYAIDATFIDQLDLFGRTSLMIAARGTDLLAVQWLLSRKEYAVEYINARDRAGMNAFLHSCYEGTPEIVKALLAVPRLNIYERCHRGLSALDWLFRKPYDTTRLEVLAILTESGMWGMSAIREAFLRSLEISCYEDSRGPGHGFVRLLSLIITFEVFSLDLDDTDTILLLAHASRRACRVADRWVQRVGVCEENCRVHFSLMDSLETECPKNPTLASKISFPSHRRSGGTDAGKAETKALC